MNNIIKVIYSEDWMDCETCGGGAASSTLIKFNSVEFGVLAMATCFDSNYADSYRCFIELFNHLELKKPDEDEYGYISDDAFISQLREKGYYVEISHEHYGWSDYDDNECYCDRNDPDCDLCYSD